LDSLYDEISQKLASNIKDCVKERAFETKMNAVVVLYESLVEENLLGVWGWEFEDVLSDNTVLISSEIKNTYKSNFTYCKGTSVITIKEKGIYQIEVFAWFKLHSLSDIILFKDDEIATGTSIHSKSSFSKRYTEIVRDTTRIKISAEGEAKINCNGIIKIKKVM